MKLKLIISARVLLCIAFFWVGCVPVPVPGAGFVPVPVSEMVSKDLYDRKAAREALLTDPVSDAIRHDNAAVYKAALQKCGAVCPADDFPDKPFNGTRMLAALQNRAWHVLAYQLSQISPEARTRLLHRAGGRDYGGSRELVDTLLSSGARADGIALANGVLYCRTDMVRTLLDHGAWS